ncbi:MAG: transporter [Pseudomonadota bacterium]
MRRRFTRIGTTLALLSFTGLGFAQDIEPRRWTPLPIGMNILGVGAVHTDGDIALDPVLELEDVTVEVETIALTFLHSFELLGKSARFDVRLPYKDARWEGLLAGEPASTERKGMGDPRLRLSVNFLGAPALKGRKFQAYRASHPINTVVGAALSITLPLGEYKQDKLLNLGENRFVFRPQLGFVHTRGHWSYELTGSVFLYTDNDDFLASNKREQDPLYAVQTHLTYIPSQRWWASIGAGYDLGGESRINGVKQDDQRRDLLYGISAGLSIGLRSSVKLAYIGSRTHEDVGQDTDSIAFGYSIRF